jgi:hypothetical protein
MLTGKPQMFKVKLYESCQIQQTISSKSTQYNKFIVADFRKILQGQDCGKVNPIKHILAKFSRINYMFPKTYFLNIFIDF